MSLLSKIRAALAVPAAAAGDVRFQSPYDRDNHLWNFVAPDWFPTQGMSREVAMSIPAVNRARRTIAHGVARIPLRAYRGETPLADAPLWLDRTDGPVSPYHRMLWTVDDLFFHGISAWAVQRNTAGLVIAADRVPFDSWAIDPEGRFVYNAPDGSQTPADPRSVIVIPGSDEGILNTSGLALSHARSLIVNASKATETPAAYINIQQTNDYDVTQEEIDQTTLNWRESRAGKNGGVAFTSAGLKIEELGAPLEHLLIEGRNAAALDVARAAGVPGVIVDANNGTNMTYENAEQKARDLIDYGLSAYMQPISARLGMDDMSPRGTSVAFDLESHLGSGTEGAPDDGSGPTRTPTPTARTIQQQTDPGKGTPA